MIEYEPLPDFHTLEPGWDALEYNVIVLPKTVKKLQTKSSLIIPDSVAENEDLAMCEGLMVSVSPHAFTYADDWPDPRLIPKAGDEVMFAKYGGRLFTGPDGREYRVMKDKDIVAVTSRRERGVPNVRAAA